MTWSYSMYLRIQASPKNTEEFEIPANTYGLECTIYGISMIDVFKMEVM